MATATAPTQVDPYEGLNSQFAYKLHQLVQVINENGGHLTLASGKRDTAQQTALYNAAVAKYGPGNATNWAARPGTSNHELGLAMDLGGDPRSIALAHQIAGQFGLNFPLANEAWHVEPVGLRQVHNNNGGPAMSGPPIDGSEVPMNPAEDPRMNNVSALLSLLHGGSLAPRTSTSDTTLSPQSTTLPGDATQYDTLFQQAGSKYDISPALLKAVAKQESGFNPSARSPVGATGIMQFMPGTAAGLGINPSDPNQAINGAAKLLSGYIQKYGSVDRALAAYNAGPGAVERYNGVPPYAETQNYVKNIMSMAGGAQ